MMSSEWGLSGFDVVLVLLSPVPVYEAVIKVN
jgi:hypothetical protein